MKGNSELSFDILDYEMVHWNSPDLFIAHKANTITYINNGAKKLIELPMENLGWKKWFMPLRKARRALRIDKTVILPCSVGLVAIRGSYIYVYDCKNESWSEADIRLNCRNPMYNAFLNVDGVLYIGEYGNPNGIGKRILMSKDAGFTWKCVYQFQPEEIRHIHSLEWDPYENKIWIFTGDSDQESQVLSSDKEFQKLEIIGGGTQYWRSCHAIFFEEHVDWIMDSPLKEVRHIRFNRTTRQISVGESFAGPVWFARSYGDWTYAASAQEIGPSHKDKLLHLYKSKDLEHWEEIEVFQHDGWPKRYFRFGVMVAVRGSTPMFSCEGVKNLDGKTICFPLEEAS